MLFCTKSAWKKEVGWQKQPAFLSMGAQIPWEVKLSCSKGLLLRNELHTSILLQSNELTYVPPMGKGVLESPLDSSFSLT